MKRSVLLFFVVFCSVAAQADGCGDGLSIDGRYLESLLNTAATHPQDPNVRAAREALAVGSAAASQQLVSLGRDFDLLALHPGVASRIPRFVSFVHDHPGLAAAGAAAALTAFRAELGQVGLSRAILLNTTEHESLLRHGLIPNFVRNKISGEAEMYLWLARTGLAKAVDRHMSHAGAKMSPFASFSQQQDLTRLVVNVPPNQDRLRYVWRISLDVLDVVYVHASGPLIEEALVFAFVPPERFDQLRETAGESFAVTIADMLEDRRFTRFGGDLLIPKNDLPHVERAPRARENVTDFPVD